MSTNVVSGGGFRFSLPSVGGTWSWTVHANNVQGGGQLYEISDITTPYGSIYQTAIPIPGDVVTGMSDSLRDMQQQLAPLLALLLPSQTSFNVTIVEGDSNLTVADIGVYNAGNFGSFLTATATPSAPWLRASPASLAGLGKNEQGSFGIVLLTGSLLESSSPYTATVLLQDNRVPATQIPIAFTVTVLPRPTVSVSPLSVSLTYMLSTSTGNGPATVTVQNSGPANSSLSWTASSVHNTSPWLSFLPVSGGPLASGATEDMLFDIVGASVPQVPGTYTDSVRISSPNSTNGYVDVDVTLTVT